MDDNDVILPLDIHEDCLIKVIGVGGGGGNSVDYMYKLGVENITYLVCNTDRQALAKMSVPAKLQLGPGLGAGGKNSDRVWHPGAPCPLCRLALLA